MKLIVVKVPVKVACHDQSMTVTDCRQRAITMLLIIVELKLACMFTLATDCSHRPTYIILILVEVSVNVAVSPLQQQTAVTELKPCYLL